MMNDEGCKQARMPEVTNQLACMDKELARAAELHDSVQAKIGRVLRDEPPSGGCAEGQPDDEQLTPLAGEIRESVRKLQRISEGYERMLDRIEL